MNISTFSPRMVMACIGDASRFRLVQALIGGARCVTDLAGEVGLSQSCTTRHLQALERRRVVCGTREGKRVVYRLCHEEPALGSLLAWAMSPEGGGPARQAAGPPGSRPRPQRRVAPRRRAPIRPGSPTALQVPASESRGAPAGGTGGDNAPAAATVGAPPARARRPQLEDYLL